NLMDNPSAARAFCTWMREKRGAQPGTMEKYQRLTQAWATWLPTDLADRTPEDVEAFTSRPRLGGQPAANPTRVTELAGLAWLQRWGKARLGWGTNPAVLAGRPRVHNRQPRPVDDDTWLSVWTSDLPIEGRVALGLGFYCGLRREEVVRLRANQVWGG